MLGKLISAIKGFFNEIEIDIEITPSDTTEIEFQMEVEAANWLYSYRLDQWLHFSQITPLETTWGDSEVAITDTGIVILAIECVWADGYAVSDVSLPTPPVSMIRQALNEANGKFNSNDYLRYATGGY